MQMKKISFSFALHSLIRTFAGHLHSIDMDLRIKESDLRQASAEGAEAYVMLFHDAVLEAIGGVLNADTMPQLSPDQITLLAYVAFRREVMEGGFIQLIHNGYGPFIFMNPFAKAIGQWGAKDLKKLVYDGRLLYLKNSEALSRDCTDEEFMALYEQFPKFDDLDDDFVEMEDEVTALVAQYIKTHLANFAQIVKVEEDC